MLSCLYACFPDRPNGSKIIESVIKKKNEKEKNLAKKDHNRKPVIVE